MTEEYISLDEIANYLPKNKLGKEMYECIQSIPPRFRDDAFCAVEYCEDFNTLRKAWDYFLDDIYQELTLDEKIEYNFTTWRKIDIEKTAKDIADELMFDNKKSKTISNDTLEKECYLVVADLKGDIQIEIKKYLKHEGYEVI